MERIVREASLWLDQEGAIIDPNDGTEYAQSSPRFAAPAAILLYYDRIADLEDKVYACMDHCTSALAHGEAEAPDFWMRELMTAFFCLKSRAPESKIQRWSAHLISVDSEKTYWKVCSRGIDIKTLHNWVVYSSAGEWMRHQAGLGPSDSSIPDEPFLWGRKFFDHYMDAQRFHFTSDGMYRDPGAPVTYDYATRLQIATALKFGYDGHLRADLDELLRRGGLTMLLYMGPDGQCPYGGRSNQFNFNEAIIAALCEVEASRYKESDPFLAGVFRRQAAKSAAMIAEWVTADDPARYCKHWFSLDDNFGADEYAKLSCYGLLTASFLGLAILFADEEIVETICPAETGGYVLESDPSFHKVFASCGGTQVQLDTRADLKYDATGLGRFARQGVPIALGLNMPMAPQPHYHLPAQYLHDRAVAIGPSWQDGNGEWISLANLSEELEMNTVVAEESGAQVKWSVIYRSQRHQATVTEKYRLTDSELNIRASILLDSMIKPRMKFSVPLLATDGRNQSITKSGVKELTLTFCDSVLRVLYNARLQASLVDEHCANRNGIYQTLHIACEQPEVDVTLQLLSL
ncbi:MAG: hypothetical protein AAF571_03150 [Verrucomicrobiota bacterium]